MQLKSEQIEITYQITSDPSFQNKKYGIDTALSSKLESLYREALDPNNKSIIAKLTELIIEYPKAPILKNYLTVAYNSKGIQSKAIEINKWLLAEHPDYLFGKLNLAYHYLAKKDFEKIEEILGSQMDIKALYPDRDLFHEGEVTSFFVFAINYFLEIGDMDAADIRLQILQDIAPKHPFIEIANKSMRAYYLEKANKRWIEEQKTKIKVDTDKLVPEDDDAKAIVFNHPIIKELYNNNYEINQSIIKDILALPRETLVADLEAVLKDAVNRYNFFYDKSPEDTSFYFPIHALLLLAELKSDSSLPLILDILSYETELIEFWFDGFTTEDLWLVFFKLAPNNLDTLKRFLLKPAVDTYVKAALSTAIAQLLFHKLATKEELVLFYKEVLEGFLKAGKNDNLVDSDLLGFIVIDIVETGLVELLPIMKELFKKGYISEGVCGSYKDVADDITPTYKPQDKKEVFTVFEFYDSELASWLENYDRTAILRSKYNTETPTSENHPPIQQEENITTLISNKIGRNDPCPCGSGKKYKKCCME